ncbi:hypothetical protein ACN20G_29775 (plasmid) [Streptomyces sp. BI20]|uniref:hypothetical protein n=1 Tax=Streptomyces sp. BI20 TaxID=3403460 RepID=UPI003C75DC5F
MKLLTANTARKLVRTVEYQGDDRFTFKGMNEGEYAAGMREYHQGRHCQKCGGLGKILGYAHIEGGKCFTCWGAGLSGEVTVIREYTVLSRAWLEHMDAAAPLLKTDVGAWLDATMNAPEAGERIVTVTF